MWVLGLEGYRGWVFFGWFFKSGLSEWVGGWVMMKEKNKERYIYPWPGRVGGWECESRVEWFNYFVKISLSVNPILSIQFRQIFIYLKNTSSASAAPANDKEERNKVRDVLVALLFLRKNKKTNRQLAKESTVQLKRRPWLYLCGFRILSLPFVFSNNISPS